MNKLILTLLWLIPFAATAQIQALSVDNGGRQNEIVVIKDNQESDQEILAQNFDLNNYRVGDVIRITTASQEKEPSPSEIKSIDRKTVAPAAKSRVRTTVKRKKKKSYFGAFKIKKRKNRKVKKVKRYTCYRF